MVDVSVVIPIGRVDEELKLQFDALDNQNFTGSWELILSLNSRNSAEKEKLDTLAKEFKSAQVIVADSSSVKGASYARNVGAKQCSAEFILFCDGDDIAEESWISKLFLALQNSPNSAVGGHLEEDLLSIEGQENWRPPATPGELPSFLGHKYLVSANMGVSKQNFLDVGGFREDLIRCEDIAFSWDLIEKGIDLEYVPSAVIYYRHRKGLKSMIQQHYLYGRGFSQLLKRQGTPGGSEENSFLSNLKPNAQPVSSKNFVYFTRRGSIAAGRIVGLAEERFRK